MPGVVCMCAFYAAFDTSVELEVKCLAAAIVRDQFEERSFTPGASRKRQMVENISQRS